MAHENSRTPDVPSKRLPNLVNPRKVERLPSIESLPPGSRHAFRLTVADGPDGPVELAVNVAVGDHSGPQLVAVGGVHGNEFEGPAALLDTWDDPGDVPFAGTLVVVPVANPPAFRASQRTSPSDGLDMNRVFPGRSDGVLTELLAKRLFDDVVLGSDFLLSMHSWYASGTVLPYVEVPASGSTVPVSRAAARAFGVAFVEPFDWHPGLLVSAAGRAGIPAMEPEIGGLGVSVPERRALYRSGLRNLLMHLGMLPGVPSPGEPPRLVTRTEVTAPTGGFLRPLVEVGTVVSVTAPMAWISDLNGLVLAEIAAPSSGVVAALRLVPAVEPGDQVAVVFHPGEVA